MNLLIAEDNPADVFLIRESLKLAGLEYNAAVASNGEKALALLQQFAESPSKPLQGMILDLNLNTHSGFDILRRLRALPELAAVAVVILTSSDSPQDRDQAQTMGTDGYFKKPLDLSDFMEIGKEIADVFRAGKRRD